MGARTLAHPAANVHRITQASEMKPQAHTLIASYPCHCEKDLDNSLGLVNFHI